MRAPEAVDGGIMSRMDEIRRKTERAVAQIREITSAANIESVVKESVAKVGRETRNSEDRKAFPKRVKARASEELGRQIERVG